MTDYEDLIKLLNMLGTEQVNPDTVDIDRLSPVEIAHKINAQDKLVAGVVEKAVPQIARAAELFADTINKGGRVLYVGAGTSGRLGVLDAAECPPTFGTHPGQIAGIISGGYETLVLSREGVEDDRKAAVKDLKSHSLSRHDFVVGIAASSRTPYTLAAVKFSKSFGCRTALIVCNTISDLELEPDVLIELPVGPEAITGSTRMKSGTAQKMALNMMSTTAMVLLGKTYGNLMVDLQVRSDKLAARSRKMLVDLFDISVADAEALLEDSGGSVKLAIVMMKLNVSAEEARGRLSKSAGRLSSVFSTDK